MVIGHSAHVRETTDLVIRPFAKGDCAAAHAVLDVDQDEPGMTALERAAMIEYRIRQLELDNGVGCYAVEERATRRLMGYVGLQFHLLPGPHGSTPEVELFYKFGRSFRGRGFATQACRAMLDYAFDVLQIQRTVSVTERDNTRSVALLQRLGAQIADHPARDDLVLGIIAAPHRADRG